MLRVCCVFFLLFGYGFGCLYVKMIFLVKNIITQDMLESGKRFWLQWWLAVPVDRRWGSLVLLLKNVAFA